MGMILGSGASGGRRGRRALNAEINVTPFVDVMLVLLIVFMITAPLLVRGEEVALPKTKSGPIVQEDDAPLSITIKADGTVFVQSTQIALNELGPKLDAITKQGYDKKIFVRGDGQLEYDRLMEVVAEVRSVGYTRLAFVTEQKQPGDN